MSANKWLKFYGGEYLSDPKMDAFDGNERSIWITILSLASQTDDGWIKYTNEQKLLEKAGIRIEHRCLYTDVLQKFFTFSMLEFCNGSVTEGFRPLNWEKRQYSEGYSRVKRFRKINKHLDETVKITTEENRIEENRIDKNRTMIDVVKKKESKKTKTQRLNDGYTKTFEEFWNAYPSKIGKGKAYEVFQLLSEDLQKECVSAIINQNQHNHFWLDFINEGQGGDQPPHPTTWLNQKRWEDVVRVRERKGRVGSPKIQMVKTYE